MNISNMKYGGAIKGNLLIGMVTMILLTGCVASQVSATPVSVGTGVDISNDIQTTTPIKVVTTTNILKDWIQNVGGGQVEVYSLVPNNADPHTFKPTPKDATIIEESDIVFLVGQEYEQHWMNKLYSNVSSDSTKLIYLSDYVTLRPYSSNADHDHDHIESDPHFWHDPLTVIPAIDQISTELSRLLISHQSYFSSNASAYIQKLNDLNGWIIAETTRISQDDKILITSHENLGYFANRYGFEIIKTVIPGVSSAESLTPKDLASVIDTIHQEQIPTIFIGPEMSNKIADSISAETGVNVLILHTESLDMSDNGANEYITLIRKNVITIVNGLLDGQ